MVLGLLTGIFTYGQPIRKEKKSGGMDDAIMLGMIISHALIDFILGKFRRGKGGDGGWLDNQKILAMMRGMHPSEFEKFIAEMFAALGYETEVVGGKSDGGIDIEMTKGGRRYVVQCKKFITRKVRPTDVRDFFGAMIGRNADGKGFFVTTNIFTTEAELFAEGKPLELIDGLELVSLVRQNGMLGKIPAASSIPAVSAKRESCPACGGVLTERANRNDGSKFLGCSNFPSCRYTKSL